MKLQSTFVFSLAVVMVFNFAEAKAKKSKAPARDVASISEEDDASSGILMKIEGLDGQSGVPSYETYFKMTSLNLSGYREKVTEKMLAKKVPADPAKKEVASAFVPGMRVSLGKNFDPKSSLSLQKLMFSKKFFQPKIVILVHGKVTVEYSFSEAFFASYSVAHMAPENSGYNQPDAEYFDISFGGYQVSSPKTKDSISEKEE